MDTFFHIYNGLESKRIYENLLYMKIRRDDISDNLLTAYDEWRQCGWILCRYENSQLFPWEKIGCREESIQQYLHKRNLIFASSWWIKSIELKRDLLLLSVFKMNYCNLCSIRMERFGMNLMLTWDIRGWWRFATFHVHWGFLRDSNRG